MEIITIILIAVSLSMDAFSLALIYGTQSIRKKDKLILSIIVGIYHFIMPLIGLKIGSIITKNFNINASLLVGVILILIAVEMILSKNKLDAEKPLLTYSEYLLFGLSVSIDSLTTGVSLPGITNKYILSVMIFSVTSFLFTFIGINIGDKLNKKYGDLSTLIGGSILFLIGVLYIFK